MRRYELPRRRTDKPSIGDDETSKKPHVGVALLSGASPSNEGKNNERLSLLLAMKIPSMSDPSLSCHLSAGQRRSIDAREVELVMTDSHVRLTKTQVTLGLNSATKQRELSKKDNIKSTSGFAVTEYRAALSTLVAKGHVQRMSRAPTRDERSVESVEPSAL